MSSQAASQAPATAAQIRAILGEVDDRAVVEILELGASHADVLQASRWRDMPAVQRTPGEFELHGRAARVLELIEQLDPPEPDAS
ncbi:MAG: hypothetical protein KGJ64_05135 [Betaproteobacteria bacterium]|nr:hypothetical protein [Betaproteobacteria bacterium]